MDLSAEPNGQHVPLLTRQLLLSSAFLPSCCLAHAFFLFSSSAMHAHAHMLIFTHFLFSLRTLPFVEEE